MKTYTGDFQREGDVWVAEVREVPQAHTYGRTLARAKDHLRDALALYLNVPIETINISIHVKGLGDVTAIVESAVTARRRADDAAEQARLASVRAASALVQRAGFSLREAAVALGISHQRVEQLLSSAQSRPGTAATGGKAVAASRTQRKRSGGGSNPKT